MYLIPPTLFYPPKPKINEKMRDLPKLAWSRDVTGKVDNIHSNLTRFMFSRIVNVMSLAASRYNVWTLFFSDVNAEYRFPKFTVALSAE